MKTRNNTYPLVKLSESIDGILFLLKQELKTRRLFEALHQIGLDNCYYRPHLDSVIMRSMDLDDGTDETFIRYDDIVEKRSRKIKADNDSITKHAFKAYMELLEFKKTLATREKQV
jgi:hypothetical protein